MYQNTISFSRLVKDELVANKYPDERLRSLLSAFTRINGSLHIIEKKSILLLKTENVKIAKFIYQSFIHLYGVSPSFVYLKKLNFKKKIIYQILIEGEINDILSDLEIDFLEGKIAKNIIYNDELISAYLIGAFLSSGSVNSPYSKSYHLEISLNEENYAKWFQKLFLKYHGGSFDVKVTFRRDKYVIYLKKADQIVDFLILLGATEAALKFEEIRLDRDFASIGNRLENLDKANLNKTLKSSSELIDDINLLESKGVFLSPRMQLFIKLRKEYEDASFKELAEKMSDILKVKITRSNINHLARQIRQKASNYHR